MINKPILNLFTSIQQADFKSLLKGKPYLLLQGQLIFEKGGEIFITTIDENRNDFTVEDYLALPEGAPFELINGKLTHMPSPKDPHQQVSINLSTFLNFHVRKHKLGLVRTAPMDVHLAKNNILQPDILFIASENKHILKDYVYGAPDFIVEILSPGTQDKDRGEKMEAYGSFGVKEYWLIDAYEKRLEIFQNKNAKLIKQREIQNSGTIESFVIKDFTFELSDLFDE